MLTPTSQRFAVLLSRYLMLSIVIGGTAGMFACNSGGQKENAVGGTAQIDDMATLALLKEAYLFGYPLVVMDATKRVMTNVQLPVTGQRLLAPINQLVSAIEFPTDQSRDVVRTNADTYYTMGWIDLAAGPLVLELPDTKGRYYLFPMLDAWTNVFFSPGSRTTGTAAQTYLLTGPGWNGEVPKTARQVKAPTNMVWIIGRIQVNNPRDGATTVKRIQDQIKVYPLSSWGKPYAAPEGKVDPSVPAKTPNDIVTDMPVADYFNRLNQLMVSNPPDAADSSFLQKLAPLGIGPGGVFDITKFPAAIQDSIKAIATWAKADLLRNGLGKVKRLNGWDMNSGLGTYGTNYSLRAGVAYNGLGANLDDDALYPSSQVDADGQPLDGSKHRYVLHFDKGQTPPSSAFWSVTLYDAEGFMAANPIQRFAIGDRNPLKKNADGSIDIFIQKEDPGKDKQANWLPCPDAPFNLLLRVYWPKPSMIKGDWVPPAVIKQARDEGVTRRR